MTAIRRHAIVVGFLVGAGLGALFVVLRVSNGIVLTLLGPFQTFLPVGVVALVLSGLAVYRGIEWARPIAVVTGVWVGFFVGFLVVGLATCAFCLA